MAPPTSSAACQAGSGNMRTQGWDNGASESAECQDQPCACDSIMCEQVVERHSCQGACVADSTGRQLAWPVSAVSAYSTRMLSNCEVTWDMRALLPAGWKLGGAGRAVETWAQ